MERKVNKRTYGPAVLQGGSGRQDAERKKTRTCAATTMVLRLQMLLLRLGTRTSRKVLLVCLWRVDDWRDTAADCDGLGDSRRLPADPSPPVLLPPPRYVWNRLDSRCRTECNETRSDSYSNDESESRNDVCVWTLPRSPRRSSASILTLCQSKSANKL